MQFGTVPLREAAGAILAHSLSIAGGMLKKGRCLDDRDLHALAAAGHTSVVVARLEAGDVGEDDAAARVASALAGPGVSVAAPFTGRANLFASTSGIVVFDDTHLRQLNRLDEGLTVATVRPFDRAQMGQILATIKIITFAVREPVVSAAEELVRGGLLSIAPFQPKAAGLILTRFATTKESLLQKRQRVISDRLESAGSRLAQTVVVQHSKSEVAAAIGDLAARGCDPILVFAASAIVDRSDIIPAALIEAGGAVIHLGMPVDPGNLLMMGRFGSCDVIGVPSCAGSPKLNGFDWVLERCLAGLRVGREEISALGAGGLLKEIPNRPQPRDGDAILGARREPRIVAIVLAAGRSTRMSPDNKLTEPIAGKPMVRYAAEAALASRAASTIIVTGHQSGDVALALGGLDVTIVHNPDYALGLASSLKAGIAALPEACSGAIVLLGDMPQIAPGHIDRLIAAFEPKEGRAIVVPVHNGKRGNPVLWGAEFFREIEAIEGDTGARHLIGSHADRVVEVALGTDAIFLDIDTPAALAAIRKS